MATRLSSTLGVVAAALLVALLAGAAGVFFSRPAAAQTSVGVTGMRQVSVAGRGEVSARPDTATVQIGVETEAPTAAEALAQNSQQAQAVQQRLKDLGVAEKDMQTANFSIYPVYGPEGRTITGYHVSNSVQVTVRGLDQAGSLLDEVVKAGANSVGGISFSVANQQALLDTAREQAIADARARAETLAKAAGASVGQVLVISEGVSVQPPVPMMARAEMAQDAASVPVQAGEQRLTVDIQVTFSLS